MERASIAVVQITAMSLLAKQLGANRIVTGVRIPHPLGDPNLASVADFDLRKEIVMAALSSLEKAVAEPTIFVPNVSFTSG